MIEKIVRDWLMEKLDVPVYTELPPSPPARYVLIETVGGDMTNHIHSAMVSAVTRGSALMDAIETAGRVKKEMLYGILESDDV
ncbi:MAG: hypothetical protein LBS85_00075, partial [Clostridiales Family XIII bacterium]|nr:hypothetical protein [Clostridiales Family XIII bacterium]